MQQLRAAIEKARSAAPPGSAARRDPPSPGLWESLRQVSLDPELLASERIVSWQRAEPAHRVFDQLRGRVLQVMRIRGWRRIGIAAPTPGCGATTTAVNLALSLARRSSRRVLLLDLAVGAPGISRCLGQEVGGSFADWLSGEAPVNDHFLRLGLNLALGIGSEPVEDGAMSLEDPECAARLGAITAALAPDVEILDLAPLLGTEEGVAALRLVDGVVVVASAGRTTAEELAECRRLVGEESFAGVVLNRCDDRAAAGG